MKNHYWKEFSVISTLAVLAGIILTACKAEGNEEKKLSEVSMPLYFFSVDNEESIRLYFADESKDIPYLDVDTVAELVQRVNHEVNQDKGYSLEASTEDSRVTITRENNYPMQIDCEKDLLSFIDFDAFFVPSWSNTVIDVLQPDVVFDGLELVQENSNSRFGSEIVFDLGKYGIDLIEEDGFRNPKAESKIYLLPPTSYLLPS